MPGPTKVTLLFHASTIGPDGEIKRVGGFSESYYSPLDIKDNNLFLQWDQLCKRRAALLPTTSAIIGSRYQTVDPLGASRSYDTVYKGGLVSNTDLPTAAALFTVRSQDTPNQRSLILRGVPDENVVKGEWKALPAWDSAILAFFSSLTQFWRFRALNRANQMVAIFSIDANRLMTTTKEHGLAIGNEVEVKSTRSSIGEKISYVARVQAVPSPTTATIVREDGGDVLVTTKGRMRKHQIIYPSFEITRAEQLSPVAISRKVGKPFRGFRGRQTAKR